MRLFKTPELPTVIHDGECWFVYRDWKFRIEGGSGDRKVWFIDAGGEPVVWTRVISGAKNDFYDNWNDLSVRKVMKNAMQYVDGKLSPSGKPKWPACDAGGN